MIVHPTQAIISLTAFRHNLRAVRSYVGSGVGIMAVVKANAYGHGVMRIAREAVQSGAGYLAVARIQEGLELRQGGISSPILVFDLPQSDQLNDAVSNELQLTVATLEGAQQQNRAASRCRHKLQVHLKVDTGMGRLGVNWKDAATLVEKVARMQWLELAGVYSHFATSEDADRTYAREQLRCFHSVLEEIQKRKIEVPLRHMANSGAIITLPESHFDLVRPGIMLYGYAPKRSMRMKHPLKPVMALVSRISFIKEVESGTSISYGRKYFTRSKSNIATIPIGYADGLSRLLTNRAEVLVSGESYPVVGTITMDNIMIDLGNATDVSVGDDVVVIGRSGDLKIDAWGIAATLGTIPYEVTCNISSRVQRAYTS